MDATAARLPFVPAGLVRDWVVDLLLAIALAALAVSSVFIPDPSVAYDFPPPNPWQILLILTGSLPLALRRRWPAAAFLTALAATGLVSGLGWDTGLLPVCLLFALYATSAWQRLPAAIACLLVLYAALGVLLALQPPFFDSALMALNAVAFTILWLAGLSVRQVRLSRQAAVARAIEAERTRAAAAERAVFAERLRIARELHDVVSHTLSMIAVQSGVARHLLEAQPGPASPALAAIEQASRAALNDLRRMLGVLREQPGDGDAGLTPAPGTSELQLLVSAHRAAHGPVELTLDPELESLPDSLRLTVFRLVQEALTNVRKHAPGAGAEVSVRLDAGRLVVQVDDDGTGAEAPSAEGYGLSGMAERVALFGGTLEAGPRPDGGFRVHAVLRPDYPGREAAA